mmetsp:Transcript_9405/g.21214  ORF Transcript_9405/g.21214 Transcript_9405/m.21214 type:complete len:226 (-) Transcript_9405:839-1516(-)
MSLTAVCCAEYPEGGVVLGCFCGPVPPAPPAAAVEEGALSFFFLDAAVGSLRLGLDPEGALSLGDFSFFFFPFFFKTSAMVGPSTLLFFFFVFASVNADLSLLFFVFFGFSDFSPLFLLAVLLPPGTFPVAVVDEEVDGIDGCLEDGCLAEEDGCGCGLEGNDDGGAAVVAVACPFFLLMLMLGRGLRLSVLLLLAFLGIISLSLVAAVVADFGLGAIADVDDVG